MHVVVFEPTNDEEVTVPPLVVTADRLAYGENGVRRTIDPTRSLGRRTRLPILWVLEIKTSASVPFTPLIALGGYATGALQHLGDVHEIP